METYSIYCSTTTTIATINYANGRTGLKKQVLGLTILLLLKQLFGSENKSECKGYYLNCKHPLDVVESE